MTAGAASALHRPAHIFRKLPYQYMPGDHPYIYYMCQAVARPTFGVLTMRYADGSSYAQYIESGKNVGGSFEPSDSESDKRQVRALTISVRVAWTRTNSELIEIGMYAAGFENPHPDREIESIHFHAGVGASVWMILAATLSSGPVFFAPYDDLSTGIPDGWSASVLYALIEGLAGDGPMRMLFSAARA